MCLPGGLSMFREGTLRRIIAALAAAGMASTLLSACQGTGYGDNHCTANDTITVKAGVIVGTATASCDQAPASHTMTVYLLYRTGTVTAPPRGTMAHKTSTTVPRPGADVTVQVRHTCLPGTWWVQLLVHGTGAGGAFSASDTTKLGTVSIGDCHKR